MQTQPIAVSNLSRFRPMRALAYMMALRDQPLSFLKHQTGSMGKPSKMPGLAYGIPAAECKTGSLLREKPDTVCSDCYACKGRYIFENVQTAQYTRLNHIRADLEQWAAAMVLTLKRKGERIDADSRYFRWHDSGDLQSRAHLQAICWIAARLPNWQFWLPTKEYTLVRRYTGEIPANLNIRVSAAKFDRVPNIPRGFSGSGVVDTAAPIESGDHICPAPKQSGKCGDCRACWNPEVSVVWYIRH